MLRAETRLVEGAVPGTLPDPLTVTRTYEISRDAFLLRLPNGLAFHYRRGAGVVYAKPPEVGDSDIALFFQGSVYGAIAWLNGLVPLHASAISHAGGVHAFTGVSGEGKSTLAASLARRGFPIASDDVVVLDLGDPDIVLALPGPPRLKLWRDALVLAAQTEGDPVRPGIDKFYVSHGLAFEDRALPLRSLYFLESTVNVAPGIVPIAGAARFTALRSAYFRPQFCAAIVEQAAYFRTAARLGNAVRLARFNRSRDPAEFADGIALIEADVRDRAV